MTKPAPFTRADIAIWLIVMSLLAALLGLSHAYLREMDARLYAEKEVASWQGTAERLAGLGKGDHLYRIAGNEVFVIKGGE